MKTTEKLTKTVKGKTYELWYSEFNECWMLVRNNLTILDAGDYEPMLQKYNSFN